jgi:hypothetical protein
LNSQTLSMHCLHTEKKGKGLEKSSKQLFIKHIQYFHKSIASKKCRGNIAVKLSFCKDGYFQYIDIQCAV